MNEKQEKWVEKHINNVLQEIETQDLSKMTELDWIKVANYIDKCSEQAKSMHDEVKTEMYLKLVESIKTNSDICNSKVEKQLIELIVNHVLKEKLRRYILENDYCKDMVNKTDAFIFESSQLCGLYHHKVETDLLEYRRRLFIKKEVKNG